MGVDYKFDLMLSEDGSGRGAALVAAVLKREEETEQQKQNGSSSWTENLSFFSLILFSEYCVYLENFQMWNEISQFIVT